MGPIPFRKEKEERVGNYHRKLVKRALRNLKIALKTNNTTMISSCVKHINNHGTLNEILRMDKLIQGK